MWSGVQPHLNELAKVADVNDSEKEDDILW